MERVAALRPDILLLDDPFTHVDGYTERAILQNIWPLLKDVTVIMTSTRPVPTTYVNRVLVLAGVALARPKTRRTKSPGAQRAMNDS